MANPFEKLKKLKGRSWAELRSRSEQVISVYSEQIGFSGGLPSDEEFKSLLVESNGSAETLFKSFFQNGEVKFFSSFRQNEEIFDVYIKKFGREAAQILIEKADRIIAGKFDLLGYRNLDFGEDIDWHFEPTSGKTSPLKHWKSFDELATDETGDKKVLWELNRHQHFFTLGAAYGFTKDERYAETFANQLDSWMKQNPPGMGINWFSSLEIAFRAMSWIWAFHLFKHSESLSTELLFKASKYLHKHGEHLEKYLSTYYSPNTHLTGEALGLYFLGTQMPFFKRAKNWLKLGEDILFAELDRQINSDGGYFEQTTWYHRYTVDFYTQFFILKDLNGIMSERFLQEKLDSRLQLMTNFLMYTVRPDGTTPIIGDDDGGRMLPHENSSAPNDFRACLSTNAVLFGRGDYKFTAGDFAEETLWLLGTKGLTQFEELHTNKPMHKSFAFEASGYFVMRDGWTKTDNYLIADCGEVGSLKGGHGHADALAIEVAVSGETILVDPGTYTYHESKKLRDSFRITSAHNTLTIDGRSQSEPGGKFNWKTMAESQHNSWISKERFDFFEGSHNGYERLENAPATHSRSILFLKNDYWIIRDFVKTKDEHEYALNFHFDTATNPQIDNATNGDHCISSKTSSGNGLRIFTFGDNGSWKIADGLVSNCYGKSSEVPVSQFASKGIGSQEFFTFLLPYEKNFSAPEVFETEIENGRAFLINFRDYYDLFVFADGEKLVHTEFFNSNFRYLWSRISTNETSPEEYVLINGKSFTLNGVEIINYKNNLKYATARRLGNRFNIRTSENIISVELPQK